MTSFPGSPCLQGESGNKAYAQHIRTYYHVSGQYDTNLNECVEVYHMLQSIILLDAWTTNLAICNLVCRPLKFYLMAMVKPGHGQQECEPGNTLVFTSTLMGTESLLHVYPLQYTQ